jgi:hypothetical protein
MDSDAGLQYTCGSMYTRRPPISDVPLTVTCPDCGVTFR